MQEFLLTVPQSDRADEEVVREDFDPLTTNPFVQEPEEDGWALGV